MKLTEKELNEFPIGTKIKIKLSHVNREKMLLVKINKLEYIDIENKNNICSASSLLFLLGKTVEKVEIPTYTEYIPSKPILDDKEKEYLSGLVKPFKSKVKHIAKEKLYCNNNKSKEYIAISCFDSIDSFEMPLFKPETMYKGMELDKEYSLEELGL